MTGPPEVLQFNAPRCHVCGEPLPVAVDDAAPEKHWCRLDPTAFAALLENAAASYVLIDTIAHPPHPLIATPGRQRPRLNLNILAGTVKKLVDLGILTVGKPETEQ